jgi:transposase
MEDVLDVYQRPLDAKRPQVCLDEKPVQLIGEKRIPIPAEPGRLQRYDYQYERNGVVNLFMVSVPLLGFRHVEVTERRTAKDLAEILRWLAEDEFAEAEAIVLVTDNLNTHTTACLYEAFEPERAQAIARKFEWHYTPKHGSWLNMAEIELAALGKQCLGKRRIGSKEELASEVAAWEEDRNTRGVGIHWQFRTADARIKLRHLYPPIQ